MANNVRFIAGLFAQPHCISERNEKRAKTRGAARQRIMANLRGRVMTLAHICYDSGCALGAFYEGKQRATRIELTFSSLLQSALYERTSLGLALFPPKVSQILALSLVYADECSGDRVEMLLS